MKACAVFTVQESSASQMTAAKVMDLKSRPRGCAGQAADATSAHPCRNGRCTIIVSKIPKSECPDIWVRKIQSFLLSEISMIILGQDYYEKGNSRKFYCSTVGKRFPIGNARSLSEKKDYFCLCMWTIYNWLERSKTLTQCGSTYERR